ncbi:sulfurtransferase TusA family protein [Eubacteriaceae bacterium ES3]|nr:sulfurtransferase TusA family protein [Eubacteriaceae bacterium ES3]
MAEIKVDVRGQVCPVPLVEMRKAVRKAEAGDVIEIVGDNAASRKEIPMAADALSMTVELDNEEEGIWKIRVRK